MSDTPIKPIRIIDPHSKAPMNYIVYGDYLELQAQNLDLNAKLTAAYDRLKPSIEYVEGVAVGYGEDEIDRLEAKLAAADVNKIQMQTELDHCRDVAGKVEDVDRENADLKANLTDETDNARRYSELWQEEKAKLAATQTTTAQKCHDICMALDSLRGNEKEIAKAIVREFSIEAAKGEG